MRHANIAVFVPHNGCPNTCSFCNQRTISGNSSQPTAREVSELLEAEQTRFKAALPDTYHRELAFFGGSFTAICRDYMLSLLEAAQPFINNGLLSGIRCSTRPDCIDPDILGLLKDYHVTAIELGAQSMDDNVLMLNSRGHSAQDVADASRLIKSHGFELGLQMMTGLYGDTDETALKTAERLAALMPDTMRIYPTVVLRGTGLARLFEKGVYNPPDAGESVGLCAELLRYFQSRGIRVIRLGLHASREIESEMVSGAYHPAMRELCESRLFLSDMLDLIKRGGTYTDGSICIKVNPRDISKALGQKRSNILYMANEGYNVRIIADGMVSQNEMKIDTL